MARAIKSSSLFPLKSSLIISLLDIVSWKIKHAEENLESFEKADKLAAKNFGSLLSGLQALSL